jgi:glycosyltransferase involved in cell wall biosynthesis/tetratricopeptide (TPR) repeat protein
MSNIDSKKYVLVISHVMPVPAAAGNETRILKVLQFLKNSGYSVIFLLNQKYADDAAVAELKKYVDEFYTANVEQDKINKTVVAPSIEFLKGKNEVKHTLCPPELVYFTWILGQRYNPVAVIAEYIFTAPCLDVVPSGSLKIIDTHDMMSKRNPEEEIFCTVEEEREYLLKCDLIMAIQPKEAALFAKYVPERNVISVGIDYDFNKHYEGAKVKHNSVLVIGSDNAANVKGLKEFYASAWPLVLKSVPDAQLKVGGKISNEFKVNDKSVIKLGFIEDLEAEYRNAAIIINPTTVGTGLKIKTVEALCHGKAFIGTLNSVEGLPEFEQEPFIACEDWNSLAKSIIELLKSDQKRKKLEKAAFNYALQNYNTQTVYSPLLQKLESHSEVINKSADGIKNRIKIGLMNKDNENLYGGQAVCFQISKYDLSFNKLFYSSFATPARYIMEMFVRLYSIHESDDPIVVFNPFFVISKEIYSRIKLEINREEDLSEIIIFSDSNETPIAYIFPGNIPIYDARYLSFLSGMYAELDAAFLRNIFLIKTRCAYLPGVGLNKNIDNNGFIFNSGYERLYAWITDSALKTLHRKYTINFSNQYIEQLNEADLKTINAVKHEIPCNVIMPYHAGDALFLMLALKNSCSFINKVVISDWYSDIIEDASSEIEALPIRITPGFRGKNSKSDDMIFWDVVSNIKGDDLYGSFHYFFRSSREYRISDFHLIDHFYFAIGSGINTRDDLLTTRLVPENRLPEKKEASYRVLIHFEGGWPLKTYPDNYLQELIKIFYDNGYKITLLSSKAEISQYYDVVKYTNLADYKNLLESHNLVLGMDSFPVHYAAHVAGIPTICIFGNTKPVNSDAPSSKYYKYAYGELKCAGCFGFDKCPLNKKATCDNFPKPEQIFGTAAGMLEELYNAAAEEDEIVHLISEGRIEEAIHGIESVLDSKPDAHDAHYLLGRLNEAEDNQEKAILHYEKAIALEKNNYLYAKTLADYYHFKLNKTDYALTKYMEILNSHPSNSEILILVGNILALEGQPSDALEYYSKAIAYDPGNQIAIENMINLYESAGNN